MDDGRLDSSLGAQTQALKKSEQLQRQRKNYLNRKHVSFAKRKDYFEWLKRARCQNEMTTQPSDNLLCDYSSAKEHGKPDCESCNVLRTIGAGSCSNHPKSHVPCPVPSQRSPPTITIHPVEADCLNNNNLIHPKSSPSSVKTAPVTFQGIYCSCLDMYKHCSVLPFLYLVWCTALRYTFNPGSHLQNHLQRSIVSVTLLDMPPFPSPS